MSYDPSHRTPPRQERWPQATPAEGWPPPRDGAGDQAGRQDTRAERPAGSHRRQSGARSAIATAAFPVAPDTYQATGTYRAADTYQAADGYPTTDAAGRGSYDTGGYRVGDYTAGARDRESYGYPGTNGRPANATDDYDWARMGYAGSPAGYPEPGNGSAPDGGAYLGPGSYTETTYSGTTYSGTSYSGAAYSGSGYSDAGYGSSGSAGSRYPGPAQSDTGYFDQGYPEDEFPDRGFSDAGYPGTEYSDPGYSDSGYSDSGYSDPGYFDSGFSGQAFIAPDAGVQPDRWQADQAYRRAARYRGLLVSAATEFLATAVVIGVSTLAAGLLRSPVSPIGALGTVFINQTPAMLRGFAEHHFGSHGQTVLLLGMYALIAAAAVVIGVAARRAAALGVTGVAAFALLVAFVAVTRPASQVSAVMPVVIGGLAGVAALLWLVRASAPIQQDTPLRPARGGTRRRTR